jgi:hypothetical protein
MRTFIQDFKTFLNERVDSDEVLDMNFDDLSQDDQLKVKRKVDALLNLNFDETKDKVYLNNQVSFIATPIEYKLFKSYPETLKFERSDNVDKKQKFDIKLIPVDSSDNRITFDIVYIPNQIYTQQKPDYKPNVDVDVDVDVDDVYDVDDDDLDDVFAIDEPTEKSKKRKKIRKYDDFDDDSKFDPEEADKYLNNISTLDSLDDDE